MATLAEKMGKWETLMVEASQLEKEIQEEVLALGMTQSVGRVEASYRKSDKNGTVNYEAICQNLEPDQELVDAHTIHPDPYIDFKALAEAAGMTDEMKERFYEAPVGGKPKVTLKLKK